MPRARPDELDLDCPLFEALRAGEQDVLPRIMQRHGRFVRGVIFGVLGRQHDLDDVEQQVWLSVWRHSGTLEDPRRWRYWLYRLAHNAAIDTGRRLTRQRGLLGRLIQWGAGRHEAPHEGQKRLALAEEHERALCAIKGLPAIYREPFVLRHLEGWSYRQIAEALGMPTDTVETRLVRARRLLRERLECANKRQD